MGLSLFLVPGYKRGPWSLVCETEEQWVSLAESIKDKSSPQDRHLYRVISQNFLPEISSMIEHKVRPSEVWWFRLYERETFVVVLLWPVRASHWLVRSSVRYLKGIWRHSHKKYESLVPVFPTQFPHSISRVSSGILFTHQMVRLVRTKELCCF